MIPEDQAQALGLLYHLNSEPQGEWRSARPPVPQAFKKVHGERPALDLPRAEADSPLMKLIWARRSCRSFRAGTLPRAHLAEIVRGAYGLTWDPHASDWLTPPPRAVPSAGGSYPLELYVAAWTVEAVETGLYHYDILGHSLEAIRLGYIQGEFCRLWASQTEVAGAGAILIFAAVFPRTLERYAARGYRYALLEAGHAAQNACLIATELGLGSLCLGSFADARLNRFLGLDGVTEAVLYAVAVGYPHVGQVVQPDTS
jgi:SagB-type dehydrogenase family enzyme